MNATQQQKARLKNGEQDSQNRKIKHTFTVMEVLHAGCYRCGNPI